MSKYIDNKEKLCYNKLNKKVGAPLLTHTVVRMGQHCIMLLPVIGHSVLVGEWIIPYRFFNFSGGAKPLVQTKNS